MENSENSIEAAGGTALCVVADYLARFTPSSSPDDPGTELRTTDDILADLAPMGDFEPNDIASALVRSGFHAYFSPVRKGWMMKRIVTEKYNE